MTHDYRPFPALCADSLRIMQVNLGAFCNQNCRHCHVDASPDRDQRMAWETQQQILAVLASAPFDTLDLTGGSPELNPTFRRFVTTAASVVKHIKVRSNLTVLTQPASSDIPMLLAQHGVEIVASLPCYTQENVDSVRGDGVFARSIEALKKLNSVGYGMPDSGLVLTLVYNPAGAELPGPQAELEADYRRELLQGYGIEFSGLLTITNMPIGRFAQRLADSGALYDYMDLLVESYNPEALPNVMCRQLVSVSWDGRLYDCDFNQALGLGLAEGLPLSLAEFDATALASRVIRTGPHCYGCTAGAGSGCMGALVGA